MPEAKSGYRYILSDHQVRVSDKTVEQFYHIIKQPSSTAGLETISKLQLQFEPSYQELIIHYIRIKRGGETINALKPGEIRIVQKETELDQQLYNGTLSAVIFLNDVRVGDIVDYAYSINGQNPVLKGRFAGSFDLSQRVPIQTLRRRLLWPANRALQMRSQNTNLQLIGHSLGSETEYGVELHNVAAADLDDHLPAWYYPLPIIEVSEFATWEDVSRWALPLYQTTTPLPADLSRMIAEWRTQFSNPEKRLLAALRFVQDEIRYTGIELGVYSHQPNQPATVFERRFGDCKDKTFLLTTILKELGIEAYPALVNTEAERAVAKWQPSPFSFNHVIVQAKLNGKSYWLDSTISLQRGGLDQHENPTYGSALVVREGVVGLDEIPAPSVDQVTKAISERFTITSYTKPAIQEIVTIYNGTEADEMRNRLEQSGISELAKEYLNYYAEKDPDVESLGDLQVKDDPDTNTLSITEKYRLPSFWKDNQRWLVADGIEGELKKPDISRRKMPLAVTFPVNIKHTIEVVLPDELDVETGAGKLNDDAVEFSYRFDNLGKTIKLAYSFRTVRDFVPTEQVARHISLLESIRDKVSYQLDMNRKGSVGSWKQLSLLTLFVSASIVFGVYRRAKWGRSSKRQGEFRQKSLSRPGETAATAINVQAETEFATHLSALSCKCGGQYYRPEVPLRTERVIFDGRRLTAVELPCPKCGISLNVYFAVDSGSA